MTISAAQKTAIEEVIEIIVATTPARGKRQLSQLFLDLVDRSEWPEYYEVIPEPRCINAIKLSVERNRYKDALNAYTDLSLVFWNALFYNEPDSQIATDAQTLKTVLETEWQKRSILPVPRHSPPPSSAQKVHGTGPAAPPQPFVIQPSTSTTTKLRTTAPTSAVPPASESQTAKSTPLKGPVAAEERVGDSEAIVRQQLEKTLPRWQGFGELGMSEVSKDRLVEIVHSPPKTHTHEDNRDRTMLTAAGNLTVPPIVDKLPPETTKHFDRSPDTNELFWFAAPPMNIARTPPPQHSMAYLHFLATKRKKELGAGSDAMNVDDEAASIDLSNRRHTVAPPTVGEILQATINSTSTEHL
jgi:chromatin structure-remodeling complex subunit RSC1/2